MKLTNFIQKSEKIAQEISLHIAGIEIRSELRIRLAGSSLDIALDHHKAVVILISRYLHGSALAIIRPQFEAYVRGVWLHECANDSQIEAFQKGHVPDFTRLIADVEKLDVFQSGTLGRMKVRFWKAMCDFTHTGFLHLSRRHTELTIEANYDEGELIEALHIADIMALLSAIEIARIAKANNVANELLGILKDTATAPAVPHSQQ